MAEPQPLVTNVTTPATTAPFSSTSTTSVANFRPTDPETLLADIRNAIAVKEEAHQVALGERKRAQEAVTRLASEIAELRSLLPRQRKPRTPKAEK